MWLREADPNNMVINDPKGELLVKHYVRASVRGFQVIQFNLINSLKTDIYNPLALAAEAAPAAAQQSPAAPVVEALDGQMVKLPGYIVPLDMTDEGRVIEFLLVPYFGACIHVPPPPSNQIVHATSELGVRVEALYEPFWIEGPMRVEHASSELAEAGYRMQAQKIYPYELQ